MAKIKTVLTDDQIEDAANSCDFGSMVTASDYIYVLARAIEAAVLSALTPPTWRCCEKMVEQGAGNMVCCGEPIEVAVLSANAGKVDEWLPIDSAPKDGALIAFNRSKRISIEWGSHIHSLMDAALADGDDCFYTHWMPLPDSPTQQASDAGRQG